jgi:predicted AlkP superfamily pyrophosphatase or phosphodiesterase
MTPSSTSRYRAGSPGLILLLLAGCGGGLEARRQVTPPTNPVVVLVALDGFHPSYLDRAPSSHLRELARQGVRARWLVPVFPAVTFPNFYSIATGLYPEHHGVVSNTMRDTLLGSFALRDSAAVHDSRWWGGQPIWVTAVKQGKRAATYFWPGSDVAIGGVRPTWYQNYNPQVPNAERVRQVLEWISLPADSAPALVTLYLGDVDDAGHTFGPQAPETDSAIAQVDSAVGALLAGVEQRKLGGRVNLLIVSDHGMAEVGPERLIYLDDYLESGSADVVELGTVVSLAPRAGVEEAVYRGLHRAPHLKVYRKSEIPVRYHYRAHSRIQPIVAVADEGWMVTTRAIASRAGGRMSRGMHGYPPDVPSMRAIFLARGPEFKQGVVVEPFQNIHLYELIAHLLRLTPAPNDGVLDSVRTVLK